MKAVSVLASIRLTTSTYTNMEAAQGPERTPDSNEFEILEAGYVAFGNIKSVAELKAGASFTYSIGEMCWHVSMWPQVCVLHLYELM